VHGTGAERIKNRCTWGVDHLERAGIGSSNVLTSYRVLFQDKSVGIGQTNLIRIYQLLSAKPSACTLRRRLLLAPYTTNHIDFQIGFQIEDPIFFLIDFQIALAIENSI
jgi:hypothetical protein